jgi:trimeric autotransporter adhesin
MNTTHRRICWLLASVLMNGCGGGGGGAPAPAPPPPPVVAPSAPTLAMTIGLKQFRFSWTAVTGATSYRLLGNLDGVSGYTQIGADIAGAQIAHNLDISVHLHDWVNARYRLEACNAGGCTGSNEVTTLGNSTQAVGYFKNSNHEAGDNLWSIALSNDGQTLAVGSPNEDSNATGINGNQSDNSASASGAVYVFRRISGVWTQQAYIKASNANTNDGFGSHIALSTNGNTLAVSAPSEDGGVGGVNGNQADESVAGSGAVYVFVRDTNSAWTQQAYIKASHPDNGDAFGWSLDLSGSGDTLAAGTQFEDGNATLINGDATNDAAANSGAVFVFSRAGNAWSQQAYVKASNTNASDGFSQSVALSESGDVLAVGANMEDSAASGVGGNQLDNTVSAAGAVYVYVRAGGIWTHQAYIKASNPETSDQFGWAIDLSGDGNVLAVGAGQEDSSASGVNGNQSNNTAPNSGAVYIYSRTGSVWAYQAYLKASNPEGSDLFGFALALSADGNTLAVGSNNESSGSTGIGGNQADNSVAESGAVYVFRRPSAAEPWVQRAYVKAPNTDEDDAFGFRLAISGDGATLAALSPTEGSNATGIGGNQNDETAPAAGATYLY